jgi:pyruvate kinase
MLESMIESSQPTRAEVSDVSTAVFSGADAVMLSAETASGAYPVEAVQMMDRIARVAEAHMFATNRFDGDTGEAAPGSPLPRAIARSTAQLSRDLRLRAIVVLPSDGAGTTARVMAAARPGAPVVGVASSLKGMWQMSLLWGVIPRLVKPEEMDDPNALSSRLAQQLELAEPGQRILSVEGFRGGDETDTPRLTVLTV